MFTSHIGLEYKYDLSQPKFQLAFKFLRRKDLADLPVGWIDLGMGVRASVQYYDSFEWEANKFERHEKYFDVQYVVDGCEICGVCSREGLVEAIPYDKENDISFYEEPTNCSKILLNAGDFIVLSPEDVHKPRCVAGKVMPIKKIVVKVPV